MCCTWEDGKIRVKIVVIIVIINKNLIIKYNVRNAKIRYFFSDSKFYEWLMDKIHDNSVNNKMININK